MACASYGAAGVLPYIASGMLGMPRYSYIGTSAQHHVRTYTRTYLVAPQHQGLGFRVCVPTRTYLAPPQHLLCPLQQAAAQTPLHTPCRALSTNHTPKPTSPPPLQAAAASTNCSTPTMALALAFSFPVSMHADLAAYAERAAAVGAPCGPYATWGPRGGHWEGGWAAASVPCCCWPQCC